MEPTYRMAEDSPPALTWEDYATRVQQEWQRLLDRTLPVAEADVQAFLERHPAMVPGAFSTGGVGNSGHYPFLSALITQPPLRGIGANIPDFMWIAIDSGSICPVLIEIERPDKRWFTGAGNPTADFTQAQTQLACWKAWMDDPANQNVFREFYGLPDRLWRTRAFKAQYILVYGRRVELEKDEDLNRRRQYLQRNGETYMTFDRLAPSRDCAELACIRISQARRYEAVSWSPVAHFGPSLADERAEYVDLEGAIRRCDWISAERRDFLLSRLPYWNPWAREPGHGFICMELE